MTEQANLDRLMQGVIPYLCVDGAQKAADFYKKAFGAEVVGDPAIDDTGVVMNMSLSINGGCLMLMDPMPHIGTPEGQPVTNQGLTMQLVTRDGDLWWNRAVEAGCEVTHPFRLEFWGDRYGRLRDPFGIDWAINEPGAGK